jgi:hypothetical protein
LDYFGVFLRGRLQKCCFPPFSLENCVLFPCDKYMKLWNIWQNIQLGE